MKIVNKVSEKLDISKALLLMYIFQEEKTSNTTC